MHHLIFVKHVVKLILEKHCNNEQMIKGFLLEQLQKPELSAKADKIITLIIVIPSDILEKLKYINVSLCLKSETKQSRIKQSQVGHVPFNETKTQSFGRSFS